MIHLGSNYSQYVSPRNTSDTLLIIWYDDNLIVSFWSDVCMQHQEVDQIFRMMLMW